MERRAVTVTVHMRVSRRTPAPVCQMLAYLALHCDVATLASTSAQVGYRPNTAAGRLRTATDRTFGELLGEMRMQRAVRLMEEGVGAVQVAHLCGYGDVARFKKAFLRRFGVPFGDAAAGDLGALNGEMRTAGGQELVFTYLVEAWAGEGGADRADEVLAYMADHCADATLAGVSRRFDCHPNTMATLVKRRTGGTFSQTLRALRMQKADRLLQDGHTPVAQVAQECGYASTTAFYRAFKTAHRGMSPRAYAGLAPAGSLSHTMSSSS